MDNKFSNSINNIDESVFEKYYRFEQRLETQKIRKAQTRNKFFAAAACIAIFACIGVSIILPASRAHKPEEVPIIPDNQTTEETEYSSPTDTVASNSEETEVITTESGNTIENYNGTAAETMSDEIMTEAELTTESTQEDTAFETVERESEAISTESGNEIPIETTPDEITTEEIATDVDTAEDTVAETLPSVDTEIEAEETATDTVEETVIETESIGEVMTPEEDTVVDTTEQKNLSDFMVKQGDFAVNMGDVEFFPIYGFVYSGPADGVGVDFYLEGIFGGEISDGDMPYITLEEDIYVNLNGNQTLYTYCINVATKERNKINIDKLSSLPCGEYYIILRIATDMGQDSRCDEYIFKLAIKDNSLKI